MPIFDILKILKEAHTEPTDDFVTTFPGRNGDTVEIRLDPSPPMIIPMLFDERARCWVEYLNTDDQQEKDRLAQRYYQLTTNFREMLFGKITLTRLMEAGLSYRGIDRLESWALGPDVYGIISAAVAADEDESGNAETPGSPAISGNTGKRSKRISNGSTASTLRKS